MPDDFSRTDAWYWTASRSGPPTYRGSFRDPGFHRPGGSSEGGRNFVKRPLGHGTGPTEVHPTPEGAPRLEGTASHLDAENREPQRLQVVSQFSATHRTDVPVHSPPSFCIDIAVHHHPGGSVSSDRPRG